MSTIKKATAFLLVFPLYDSTTGLLKTGAAALAATVSQDGGALAAADNSVTEISGGLYSLQLTDDEMDADRVDVKVTATAAKSCTAHITTEVLTNEDVLTVPISGYEAAATSRSLLWAIAKLVNRVRLNGSTLEIKQTDDATDQFTQTVGTDASQAPVTSVDTN